MHLHQSPPPHHVVDWGHVARLERDLFGETYHHEAPGCVCDRCIRLHNDQARNLGTQIDRFIAYQHQALRDHMQAEERALSDPPPSVQS